MPDETVKQHYIALAKLLEVYRTAPLDRNLLKASHLFCKTLYQAAKAHPDLIFAQPQLYKSKLPFILNLAFNSAVLSCLLAVRNKFDASVTIQLMCGSLSIYALEQSSIEKHYQTDADDAKSVTKKIGHRNAKFAQLLKTNQQHIWLSSYLLCPYIHLNRYPRTRLTNPITTLTYMANRLALSCTPNKYKQPISFAHVVKHLSLTCCPKWYMLLIPLLQYPSVSPPGSYVRLRNGAIHIVLSLGINGLLTKLIPTKQAVAGRTYNGDILLITTEQVMQNYPCQPLNSFTRLNQWWDNDLLDWFSCKDDQGQILACDPILPIQTAPASLLVIQDQLNHSNADIAVIVKAIEKEPTYAQQLQVSASISNRQKQPVQKIQQSLAMLGFERTNSILLQHSLLSRLNQQYFPLQQALLTFSHFFVFTVSELAAKTKLVSPELASTTAYFLVSRLFTLPTIRTFCTFHAMSLGGKSTCSTYKLASLVKLKETENLKTSGVLLANAWQQNKQILEVLQNYDLVNHKQQYTPPVRQFSFLLGLSLSLAQEHYFTGKTRCDETTAYFKAGLMELGISHADLIQITNNIVSNKNIFCHLE